MDQWVNGIHYRRERFFPEGFDVGGHTSKLRFVKRRLLGQFITSMVFANFWPRRGNQIGNRETSSAELLVIRLTLPHTVRILRESRVTTRDGLCFLCELWSV